MTQSDDSYSRFRDFLAPMAQNSIQSALDSHSRENYDRAIKHIEGAEKALKESKEELKKEKENAD